MRLYDYYILQYFHFSGSDIMIGLLVIGLILGYGFLKASRKRESNPLYKYYFPGLVVKLIGSVVFCLIYGILYNSGGDTVAYWWGGEALKNLLSYNFDYYLKEMFGSATNEGFFNHYNNDTGWPPTWLYKSGRHFFLCKVTSFVCLFIPGSFLGVSAFWGLISYNGMWKLFETLTHHFPDLTKKLRIVVLFLPSTLFWCSGLMKDTIVLTGICWIVYEVDQYLRPNTQKRRWRLFLRLLIWGWLIFSVKPYVIIALVPALLLLFSYKYLSNIKSTLVKYYFIPTAIITVTLVLSQVYSTSTIESEYSPNNVIDQAMVIRNDFSNNNTYGGGRYKALEVNSSGASFIRALPEALISGLFRPFIWEARSPFILLSAVENVIISYLFLMILIKLRIRGLIKFIRSHPILLFSFVFSIILAFIVGFTSILFGALIRFRTPFLPFWFSFILIAYYTIKQKKEASKIPSVT